MFPYIWTWLRYLIVWSVGTNYIVIMAVDAIVVSGCSCNKCCCSCGCDWCCCWELLACLHYYGHWPLVTSPVQWQIVTQIVCAARFTGCYCSVFLFVVICCFSWLKPTIQQQPHSHDQPSKSVSQRTAKRAAINLFPHWLVFLLLGSTETGCGEALRRALSFDNFVHARSELRNI